MRRDFCFQAAHLCFHAVTARQKKPAAAILINGIMSVKMCFVAIVLLSFADAGISVLSVKRMRLRRLNWLAAFGVQ